MVKLWVDGDTDYKMLSFDEFLTLCESTIGPKYSHRVSESMNSYGVYWLLDREGLRLERLSMTQSQLENRQQEINDQVKILSQKTRPSINPAEGLAGVTPVIPAMDQIPNPFQSKRKPITNGSPSFTIPR